MIVADVLGPWWDVEATATDEETGETYTYRDQRRCPQFLHDITGSIGWQDVTAQLAERIPPEPGYAVWRVWCEAKVYDQLASHPDYVILRAAEVNASFEPLETGKALPDGTKEQVKLEALKLPTTALSCYDAAKTEDRVAGLVAWCRTLRPAEKPLVARER